MKHNERFYLPFNKVDATKRLVYGYASTPAIDSDGERIDKDAVAAALPDYLKFGNIREMHQNSAVGVTKNATMDEKGLYLCAKIVDDDAWRKVVEGVYKGFSIGGKKLEKQGAVITKLKLTEISVVDRPANPEATFDLWKADGTNRRNEVELKKSMSMVHGMLAILEAFHQLEEQLEVEGQMEGSPSPLMGEIEAACKTLGELAIKLTSEEVNELMGVAHGQTEEVEVAPEAETPATETQEEPVAEAVKAEMVKAKKVNLLSNDEMKALKETHMKLGELIENCNKDLAEVASLVKPEKKEEVEEAAKPEAKPEEKPEEKPEAKEEAKEEAAKNEDEKGGEAEEEESVKAALASMAKVEGLIAQIESLNAKVEALSKMKVPAKAVAKSVSKEADTVIPEAVDMAKREREAMEKGDTEELIKIAFTKGTPYIGSR